MSQKFLAIDVTIYRSSVQDLKSDIRNMTCLGVFAMLHSKTRGQYISVSSPPAFKLQNSICPSKNWDLTKVFAHFTPKRDICTKPQTSVNFLQNSMAANLTLFALNNENRISFGCNFELLRPLINSDGDDSYESENDENSIGARFNLF